MVRINCSQIPDNLMESELFGIERGAFAGAMRTKKGLIELAEGGTVFLDGIGELPLPMQTKLLAALEQIYMEHALKKCENTRRAKMLGDRERFCTFFCLRNIKYQ